jgi:hypothetical protein
MSQHSARDRQWMKLRAQKLRANPQCEHDGCREPAVTVHHVKPQATHPELRYDFGNLQSLCRNHSMLVHGKRPRTEIDPATGLPLPGQPWAWWSD